jgi:hypothetical protein
MLRDKMNGNGRRANGLFEVEEVEIGHDAPPVVPAMPAPEARPARRKRPKIVSRGTKPSDEQAERFKADLEELAAMGYSITRGVWERAMYRAWHSLPLSVRIQQAYFQEQDEVERGYGQGARPG